MNFERAIYNSDTDEIREKIIARFDSNNQYHNVDSPTEAPYFLYKNKYWKNSHDFLPIVEVMSTQLDGKKMITKIN